MSASYHVMPVCLSHVSLLMSCQSHLIMSVSSSCHVTLSVSLSCHVSLLLHHISRLLSSCHYTSLLNLIFRGRTHESHCGRTYTLVATRRWQPLLAESTQTRPLWAAFSTSSSTVIATTSAKGGSLATQSLESMSVSPCTVKANAGLGYLIWGPFKRLGLELELFCVNWFRYD